MSDVRVPDSADRSWIVLESLISLLREKNILKRCDLEELRERVALRAAQTDAERPPCPNEAMAAAELCKLTDYLGRRYGGKHRH